MYRKRPFAIHGHWRLPARAAVCRIPCRILCLADVVRVWPGHDARPASRVDARLLPFRQRKLQTVVDRATEFVRHLERRLGQCNGWWQRLEPEWPPLFRLSRRN